MSHLLPGCDIARVFHKGLVSFEVLFKEGPKLILVMTCHLFGARTFFEPMLTYCSLDILNKLYESI